MLDQMFSLEGTDIDSQSAKIISEELNKLSSQKFDYIKYRQAIKGMTALKIDEETAIQSTLMTASTMNVTVDDIRNSAQFFSQLLDDEAKKFAQATIHHYQEKVEAKKHEIEQTSKRIVELEEQIKNIELELQQLRKSIGVMQSEIESNELKNSDKKLKFTNTINRIKSYILHDISLLQNRSFK